MKNFTNNLSDNEVKDTILQLLRESGRDGIEGVIDYLENKSDFFTAPASTKFHGAAPGYLARHSLNVYYRMISLLTQEQNMYERWTEEEFEAMKQSATIVALLHDVCKTNFYTQSTRNVKDKDTKQWKEVLYYTVDDKLPYGHGEKSVYIVSSYIKLSREEAMAIRWHMGGFDSAVKGGDYGLNAAFQMFPLAVFTHLADLQATYLDEVES